MYLVGWRIELEVRHQAAVGEAAIAEEQRIPDPPVPDRASRLSCWVPALTYIALLGPAIFPQAEEPPM